VPELTATREHARRPRSSTFADDIRAAELVWCGVNSLWHLALASRDERHQWEELAATLG
jgi:hypothetical protein